MRCIIKLFDIYFLGHAQWNFQIGFSPRDRLMIYSVAYDDGSIGQIFVPHRLSFMEIVIPYGDPTTPHYGKNAFYVVEDDLGKNAHYLKKVSCYTQYHYVFLYLIELCIGYLCMCTHAHFFDDDDYHTFSLTFFYRIYKLNLISLIYQVVSMIE